MGQTFALTQRPAVSPDASPAGSRHRFSRPRLRLYVTIALRLAGALEAMPRLEPGLIARARRDKKYASKYQ
jgi:hypothetical protein